ncbi:hypothetical protein MHK_003608 [Candidatus Magnetomorum sp. HK-1]|nr:hypothetical protein MHK_003608 [Candidatus Magnetomorum sp. HK-1]
MKDQNNDSTNRDKTKIEHEEMPGILKNIIFFLKSDNIKKYWKQYIIASMVLLFPFLWVNWKEIMELLIQIFCYLTGRLNFID